MTARNWTGTIGSIFIASMLGGCEHEKRYDPPPQETSELQLEWQRYSNNTSDAHVRSLLDEAHRIVLKSEHPKKETDWESILGTWAVQWFSCLNAPVDHAYVLGTWFVMIYPDLPPNPDLFDVTPNRSQVYLVDMRAKRLIKRNEWNAVLPLYQLMLRQIRTNPAEREHNLGMMSEITSIIAFGHRRYYNPVSDTDPMPLFEPDPNNPETATLRYYVPPEDTSYTRKNCVLRITETSVQFETSDRYYDPNE